MFLTLIKVVAVWYWTDRGRKVVPTAIRHTVPPPALGLDQNLNNHDEELYGDSVVVDDDDDDDDVIVVHDCAANNPCTPANMGSYFAHANPTKYISCDSQCSEMQCAAGKIWNQNAAACVNQTA